MHLLCTARANQGGGDSLITQDPGEGHLRKALTSPTCDFIERPNTSEIFLTQMTVS